MSIFFKGGVFQTYTIYFSNEVTEWGCINDNAVGTGSNQICESLIKI